VAKIRYQYDTADTPDHTIQTTVEDAPQVIWNPKSDYGKSSTLAASTGGAADIAEYSCVSAVVKQAGMYEAGGHVMGFDDVGNTVVSAAIRSGSATYGSATARRFAQNAVAEAPSYITVTIPPVRFYCNNGDTIHLGAGVNGGAGTRTIYGDNTAVGVTGLTFSRVD